VKPIDRDTLLESVTTTQGRLISVEDHWPEGGLGDAVLAALADTGIPLQAIKLAVRAMPGSGSAAELLHAAGIDAETIAAAARGLVASGGER
jgi:transketolase